LDDCSISEETVVSIMVQFVDVRLTKIPCSHLPAVGIPRSAWMSCG